MLVKALLMTSEKEMTLTSTVAWPLIVLFTPCNLDFPVLSKQPLEVWGCRITHTSATHAFIHSFSVHRRIASLTYSDMQCGI
jgi:hypothetical protein